MTRPAAWAVQTREGQHCTPPPRLWQRRPRNVLLVMVLLLLLGSPRVHRRVESVTVEPRLKGVGPSRAKTAVEPRLQGVGPSRAKTIIYVSIAVYPRLKGVGRSRGKTTFRIFPGGLPLLLKRTPVVGRMAEAVPPSNVAVSALAKAPLVSREPVSKRVLLWC